MTWFRVDDGFADHPKVIALQARREGKGAIALWTLAGSWCSRHLTDGYVAEAVVARLGGTVAEASALVDVGLWIREVSGYRFHDWLHRNPTRAGVEAKREAQRQRVAAHRAKRERSSVSNAIGNSACNALQQPLVTPPVTPPPTRPDPTRPDLILTDTQIEEPVARARTREGERADARRDVLQVFEHWRSVFGKTAAAQLDSRRKARIEWALKAYDLATVLRCIDGYGLSDWHRGQNERGKVYDDLGLFLRDAAHVEAGLDLHARGGERGGSGRLAPGSGEGFSDEDIAPDDGAGGRVIRYG